MLGLSVGCGGVTRSNGDGDGAGATDDGSGNETTTPTVPSLDEACRSECFDAFMRRATSCKLCHGTSLKSAGLDWETPGVAARLKDVPAKHTEIEPPTTQCPVGDKLIDSTNVNQSWILKKLNGQQGACGSAMPATGPLSSDDLACMTSWVGCVAAQ